MNLGRYLLYLSIVTIVLLLSINLSLSPISSYVLDESRHVVIVAVSTLPNGSYVGVSADLYVRVTCPGKGHVYVETLPLSQIDLQASTRVAALVASSLANISFNSCDYYASIKADSPIVGGPSASGVTAVAFASALLHLPLNESIVMTGMIMPDGSIGPVGGLKYKLDAAVSRGAKVFLVPYGQVIDYVYQVLEERWGPAIIRRTLRVPINLTEYGKSFGVKVLQVASVYEALEIFTNKVFKVEPNYELLNTKISQLYEVVSPVIEIWIKDLKNEIENISTRCGEVKDDVLSYVKNRYGPLIYSQISSEIRDLESRLRTVLTRARETENLGRVYSAASMYFQALIYAYTEYYLLEALRNPNIVSTKIEDLRFKAYNIINSLSQCCEKQLDIAKLSIAINVLDRVYEALIYINKTSTLNDIISIASTIAYADARLRTAIQWAKLTSIPIESKIVVKLEDVKSMATYIETLVQNIYAYLIALSESQSIQLPSEVNEAEQRYNLMQNVSDDLSKLALGISSTSYMYQALVKLFTQSPEASVYAINRTLYTNLGPIADAIPVDSVLYLEFAKILVEEMGDYGSGAIALAKLSIIIALYKTIATTSSASLLPRSSETSVVKSSIYLTYTPYTVTSTLILISNYTVTTTITTTKTVINTLITTVYGEDIAKYLYISLGFLGVLVVIALVMVILISRKLR
ncbi:MAG: hypothetical protein LM582_00490 [Desulfurococcaceae archaeon]|nr:hypothetical protein [Desulfurococcaceae archaeon]